MTRKPKPAPTSEAGFTLTEIMVVIFIIGLLSTVVMVNVMGARSGAQVETTRAQLSSLNGALQQYSLDMYDYPTTEQGLDALTERPAGAEGNGSYRKGGYINKVPLDGWKRPFVYRKPAEDPSRPFDLLSLGADGQPGGEDENADLSVWDL
ncbi:type II secretion system major pseudopilin GspG [Henriciella aquimarina]|uniref:type II secretion system major pseudopilin GspG n=1 Tax=Henriciella aquimarina TaxID=545261 RepID=UPI0009FD88F3|nr:type II secretion system major pseudopilin GspG [Henriciella aquimarina]